MATTHACAALVDVFPGVLRLKRTLTTHSSLQSSATLVAVAELGHARVSELAEHLHLDLSTVSRQVAQLRQRRLLDASPDPADGRSQQLTLTPNGRSELRRARRALVGELAQRLGDWDDADVEHLAHLLNRLSHSLPSSAAVADKATPHSPHTAGPALRSPVAPRIQENA
jgi:DNA-binding MarR family transcriptional regulator